MTHSKKTASDPRFTFRLFIAAFALLAFLALLVTTVLLAQLGYDLIAAFTGAGAVAASLLALYRLYGTLGRL